MSALDALRHAANQLSAVAGLLQTYPRPSNDPHGRILLDALEIAKHSAQIAHDFIAKAEGK